MLMVKSFKSTYETEKHLKELFILVYISIHGVTLKMITFPHKIHCTYKMLH